MCKAKTEIVLDTCDGYEESCKTNYECIGLLVYQEISMSPAKLNSLQTKYFKLKCLYSQKSDTMKK